MASMITLCEAFDMALAHHQQGRLSEAELLYRKIIEADPRHANALYLLGRIEHQKSRFAQAADLLRQAIAMDGTEADFHQHLGEALRAQGEFDFAIAAYREALRLHADYAPIYVKLAAALESQGKLVEAEVAYRNALRLQPDFVEAHNNLGILLRQQQRWGEARACFADALRLQPDFVEAHNNLGNVLRGEGLLAEAIEAYRRALRLHPDYAPAHFNLGGILLGCGRLDEALTAFREAVRIQPHDAEAMANLGAVLNDLGNVEGAMEACRRAIAISPQGYVAHGNLGVCLQSQGRLDEAIEAYRTALRLGAENANQHSNLLYLLNYHPGYDAPTIFSEHLAWAQRHADPLMVGMPSHENDRTPGRRLRVGYVSPHFRAHAVNAFCEPFLTAHDHASVEVFCYSDVVSGHRDQVTARLQGCADHWRDIVGQSDPQVAEMVRHDQIDILVDLTGHILGGKRLLVFARKPAPVQVTYIGYQNTTGMRAMDYRLTDAYSDPPGMTEPYYTEALVRLPRSFFCYLPSQAAPPISPLPALQNEYITFGSFNNFAKVTPDVMATWAKILRAVPRSRLIVLAHATDSLRRYVLESFERYGVHADRIALADRRPHDQYLQLVSRVDIGLDPFPFNGHTTTCDCLWQGVPVVTFSGQTYAFRFGGSALVTLGLHDLIAGAREEYIEIATRLAGDSERLRMLRVDLRSMMLNSPLLDAQGFTRNLEASYRQMWDHWCATQRELN